MKNLKIYHYNKCSTCKKAIKFLDDKKISYDLIAIVETPPTQKELKEMLNELKKKNLGINKLFNTSGEVYRSMNLSTKIKSMSEEDAIALLSQNGKLIKRPFAINDKIHLIGFNEKEWSSTFN